jgi:hypothetical protein
LDRLLSIVTGISILLALIVLISVRRSHIRVEYSVSWLGAAAILFVLSRSEWLLNEIGSLIGIGYPPVVLAVLIAAIFLAVFYLYSIRLSDLRETNIELTQRIAILEYKVRNLYEKSES